MNFIRAVISVTFALTWSTGRAEQDPASKPASPKPGWNLRLIPRAFQQNPDLDITVLSEKTDAGRARPVVTNEAPVYYLFHSTGYQTRGDPLKQKPFPASEVERILQRALAAGGYRPATAEHSPDIVIVYSWGAHNVINPENAVSEGRLIRNVLDRAALVGGDKFAAELAQAFRESNATAEASARALGSGTDGIADLGAAASFAQAAALSDPVKLLKQRSRKNDFLINQASANCYYLVASAYDFQSLASPQRELLWRTRMTVNADGVSQLEAIPMMITVSAPFLGQDMPESEIVKKPAVMKGQVDIGTPTVAEPRPTAEPPASQKQP